MASFFLPHLAKKDLPLVSRYSRKHEPRGNNAQKSKLELLVSSKAHKIKINTDEISAVAEKINKN